MSSPLTISSNHSQLSSASEEQQSVDRLVADGCLTVPMADPIAAFLADRQHTTRLSVDDALTQLRRRDDLYRTHLGELLQEEVRVLNAMHSFPKHMDRVAPDIYLSIQQQLQRLAKERREERTSFWQDITRLRATVPEMVANYLTSYRKTSIFSEGTNRYR